MEGSDLKLAYLALTDKGFSFSQLGTFSGGPLPMNRRGFPLQLDVLSSLVKGHFRTSALESLLLCFLFYYVQMFFVFLFGSKSLVTFLGITMHRHNLWLVTRLK